MAGFGSGFEPGGKSDFLLPFGVYVNINPITTPGPSYPYLATIDRGLNLLYWSQGAAVVAPNNTFNYWSIALTNWKTGAIISTLNTSLMGVSVITLLKTNLFLVSSIGTSDVAIRVDCSAVGAPGNLYLAGPALKVG